MQQSWDSREFFVSFRFLCNVSVCYSTTGQAHQFYISIPCDTRTKFLTCSMALPTTIIFVLTDSLFETISFFILNILTLYYR